jgi:hypothetical protein
VRCEIGLSGSEKDLVGALQNTALKLKVAQKAENFMTRLGTNSFNSHLQGIKIT